MNLVVQIGRLVSDPETRTTASGIVNTSFRLAVQRQFKDGNGERQTDFHNCVAWRQTAEFVSRYFKKGDLVAIRGTLQNRSYDAQDGTKRYVTEIVCDNVQPCTSRSEGAATTNTGNATARTDEQTGFEVTDDEPLPF